MSLRKKLLVVLFFSMGLGLLETSGVSAVITRSPHDIYSWFAGGSGGGSAIRAAGICAYCHVPHSSKGDRLFPDSQATEKAKVGVIAALCAKCHWGNTYLGNAPDVTDEIFMTLDSTYTPTFSDMDSHPVFGTRIAMQPRTLQNTSLDSAIALDWPWTNTWADYENGKDAGTMDLECTSCHNPHDWNPIAYNTDATYGVAKRKFLRAPIYNSTLAGSTTPKNFCAYCHIGREADTSKNAVVGIGGTYGTHPVSVGNDTVASFTGNPGAVQPNNFMIRGFRTGVTLTDTSVSRAGRAIWDTVAIGSYLGARVPANGDIICQSCHMPHGVMHSQDDVYDAEDTSQLHVGPLLAINNASNLYSTAFNYAYAPDSTDYPFPTELKYTLPESDEENLLCEFCHGMTPDLENTLTDTSAFSHPVNRYTGLDIAGSTIDNIPSEPEFGTMDIRYPLNSWLKYRESGGIRKVPGWPASVGVQRHFANPPHDSGTLRIDGTSLVCLSCHEAHQTAPNSAILKRGSENALSGTSDTTFCDGCHSDVAVGTGSDTAFFSDWTTHPSGRAAALITSDAEDAGANLKLPNRAGLKTFETGTAEYISCWTCHKAHKGIERPMLADYQWPFSQICVNCHTEGGPVTTKAASKDAKWAYGTTGAGFTNANPSLYYVEGANGRQDTPGRWWRDNTSNSPPRFNFGDTTRFGSHYIGQYTGGTIYPRPIANVAANRGWLGERDVTRSNVSGSVKLTQLDHRPNTPLASGEELKDKWLMQQMADGTYDTYMVFETMTWYGSGQKSHIGTTDVDIPNRRSIICQTCHAVHNTATGVADNVNISRLLLAPNLDSYMCKRCHIPEADTTVTHPMSADSSGSVYNTADLLTGQQNFQYNTLVTRTGKEVDLFSGNYAYAYTTVMAPANYPDPEYGMSVPDIAGRRMNCDACHTAHNADSRMGAMILEGNNSVYVGGIQAYYWNKVPRIQEREDRKTCNLCHKQGK